jgi:hypothetical protein
MRKAGARWTLSSILLAGSGVLLIGVGIYFLFVRPSLPEDIRFMKLTPAELQLVGDRGGSGEVLQLINSSPGDLAPVFDAMLDNATRL